MAETKTDETGQAEDGQAKDRFGRVLDIAGICAGVALGVIIFDVLSGGKVTRLLSRKPCEGCQDNTTDTGQEVTRDG